MTEKKHEALYAGYVYEKPITYWTSSEDVKRKLTRLNLNGKRNVKAGGMPKRLSPLIDAGSDDLYPKVAGGELDCLSACRIYGDHIDIGAYEWRQMADGFIIGHYAALGLLRFAPKAQVNWRCHDVLIVDADIGTFATLFVDSTDGSTT